MSDKTPANLKERIKERLAFQAVKAGAKLLTLVTTCEQKALAIDIPMEWWIKTRDAQTIAFSLMRDQHAVITAELEPLLVGLVEALEKETKVDAFPYTGHAREALATFEKWLEAKGGKGE